MDSSPRDAYLVAQVMTAPPQRLHLMLIEGAIRLIHEARRHWAAREDDRAGEAIIRAQEIVGQLLAAFQRDVEPELVKRVAAVYLYVYRALMQASLERDEAKLADALKVLDAERETWRELCERVAATSPDRCPRTPGPAPISFHA
jgi:flagellar protein FliS